MKLNVHNPYEPLKKLGHKEALSLIKSGSGTYDYHFFEKYSKNIYKLKNREVILMYETHGFLFDSKSHLICYITYLMNKMKCNPVSHILENKLLYGSQLLNKRVELLNYFNKIVQIHGEVSIEGLNSFNALINKRKIKITNKLFTAAVLYFGELIIKLNNTGTWKLVQVGGNIYEPYIINNDLIYNPFLEVYKQLYEEFPETGWVDLNLKQIIPIK